jgi:hypothetical protein
MVLDHNTAEEAARQYEAALHDFYYDAQPEASAYHPIAMLIGLLFFATVCFCGGAMLAIAWSFYAEVPARGIMDGVR